MKNDVVKKLYTDALSRQISKLEQLQRDNEVRLAILLDLVDKQSTTNSTTTRNARAVL